MIFGALLGWGGCPSQGQPILDSKHFGGEFYTHTATPLADIHPASTPVLH